MKQPVPSMQSMQLLRQAARTLAALPADAFTKPAAVRSVWPEMIRGSYIVITGTLKNSGSRPTLRQIDEMDNVLACLAGLDETARRLLWARACGVQWRKLEQMFGRSRTSLNRDLHAALRAFQNNLA